MTKILLVEDDKSLREIYGVRLLAEGYDIVSAGDGEEALAMAIKERPNLIVSDVMMPKISGFDMLDILRSTTETKDIKVIMMTALSSEDQRLRGEKLGADRYLVKSQVGIEDVVRTVHEVLGDLPSMAPTVPTPQTDAAAPVQAPQTPPSMAQPAPQPVAPVATTPVAAAPSTPVTAPATDSSNASSLPQPTAPFSSAAPRPSGLGDRVIQPLPQNDQSTDVAAMLENELSGTPIPAHLTQPVASPAAPQQPALAAQPAPQPTAPVAPQAAAEPTLPVPPQPATQAPAPTPATQSVAQAEPPVNRPDIASLSPQPLVQSPSAPAIPNALPHTPAGPSAPVETAAPASSDQLQPTVPPATDQ